MKETSTTTVLLFPSKRESLSSEYQAEVDALPSLEYDEEAFNRILALERKRSERSKRPFMLMLLSLDRVPDGENGNDPRRKILSCLASCKRDIDVLGWYRSGSVIGIIFTEIGTSSNGTVSECITDRIRSSLASNLDPGEIEKIDISFYLFPEKPGPDGSSTQLTLYPDIKQSQNSQKKALFLKRVIDIAGSLTAIVVSAPLFLVISALIKLTDTKSHSNAHCVGFVVGPSLRCGSPLHAGVSGNASSPRPIFSEGGPSLRCGSPLHAGVSGNASSPRPIFSEGGPST